VEEFNPLHFYLIFLPDGYNSIHQPWIDKPMEWLKEQLSIPTEGKGLYPFTDMVKQRISRWAIQEGMCFLFLQHTSASLLIGENDDPSAKMDITSYFERLVPEAQPWMKHTIEGDDDSSSHIRSALTCTDLSIPVDDGALALGTWQGIYLFEHRANKQHRQVLLRCLKVK
jgi:secondary thiamine-phosphate synthase enzyme